jgi:uroporphyrinogen-III synthase
MTEELTGRRIVVPETRELGQLLRMLEERGADTVPCPMIAIRDASDPVPINAWLHRFAKGTWNDLVLMTGEGLRRPQVRRFRDVARAFGREAELRQGLERIVVAAVGPIVAAEINAIGVQVNVIPRDNTFFMKPLVRELAAALTTGHKG